MLKNLCALLFVMLAASPLTAPFQTLDETNTAVLVPLIEGDDPGSVVAPLVTKAGRLTIPPPSTGLAVSHLVPVAFLTPFITPPRQTHADSVGPTVLRV